MSSEQPKKKNIESKFSTPYFKLGLRYLLSGAQESLSQMYLCTEDGSGQGRKLLLLAKQLKRKIDLFISSHLMNQPGPVVEPEMTEEDLWREELEMNPVYQVHKIGVTRRANRRLMKANIKLKRKVRRLKISLRNTRKKFRELSKEAKSKEEKEGEQGSQERENEGDDQEENSEHAEEEPEVPHKDDELVQGAHKIKKTEAQEEVDPVKDSRQQQSCMEAPPPKIFRNKAIQVQNKEEELRAENYYNAYRDLKTKVEGLLEAHKLKSQDMIQKRSVNIRTVGSYSKEGIIGNGFTSIAVKGGSSFMIATYGKGLTVIGNNKEVFSNKFPIPNVPSTTHIIYITDLDCYLFNYNNALYRKDIDSKPPYLFMKVDFFPVRFGVGFQYSRSFKKLAIVKEKVDMSIINLTSKEAEIDIAKSAGGNIMDFKMTRPGNIIVAITGDGYLLLYKIDYDNKAGTVHLQKDLKLIKERNEEAKSVEIDWKNKYIIIQIGSETIRQSRSSRILLLSLEETDFVQKGVIDEFEQDIGIKFALSTFWHFEGHVLWVGLSFGEQGFCQLFDFDIGVGEFKELKSKRSAARDARCFSIITCGSCFYFVDYKGLICILGSVRLL